MDNPSDTPAERIDAIVTQWSLMRLAHRESVSVAGPARNALLLRYSRAIRGYVGAMVANDQDADDLAQEAVMRMLRGDFANANPERGRFRHLLKTALRNMVRNHWSKERKRSGSKQELAEIAEDASMETQWDATWQRSILDNTWAALKVLNVPAFTLLKLRAEYPDEDSEQLAKRLSDAVGRPIRPDAMRQQLRRARLLFAQLLIEEIAHGMDEPTPDRVEEELMEIGVMEYVREFLPADWRVKGELATL